MVGVAVVIRVKHNTTKVTAIAVLPVAVLSSVLYTAVTTVITWMFYLNAYDTQPLVLIASRHAIVFIKVLLMLFRTIYILHLNKVIENNLISYGIIEHHKWLQLRCEKVSSLYSVIDSSK